MRYLITFFRERFYRGHDYIVLKPYSSVHWGFVLISCLGIWGPIIFIDVFYTIKTHIITKAMIPIYIGVFFCNLGFWAICEGQYVKITKDAITYVLLVFMKKTIKLADIIEREEVAGNTVFRLASKDDEMIINTYHLSQNDISILYKQVGFEPKKKERKKRKID